MDLKREIVMNKMEPIEKLRASISRARKLGFTILPGRTFVRDRKRCCAVGSVLVEKTDDFEFGALEACARELDIQVYDCLAIAQGFDCCIAESKGPWAEIGKKLRREVESGLL